MSLEEFRAAWNKAAAETGNNARLFLLPELAAPAEPNFLINLALGMTLSANLASDGSLSSLTLTGPTDRQDFRDSALLEFFALRCLLGALLPSVDPREVEGALGVPDREQGAATFADVTLTQATPSGGAITVTAALSTPAHPSAEQGGAR